MKINELKESTTAGSIASVASPIGATQKRAGSMFKGKKTKKKFYEGEMKSIATDMDELSDAAFKKKYGKTKEEMRRSLKEEKIEEQDLIVMPGMRKMKDTSFIPHKADRRDHEVEMARSDLYAAAKDAMRIYKMIQNRSEDEGLMGWQQSYITLAADYLNSVADSLEHDAKVAEMTGGVLAGGMSNFEESSDDLIAFKSGHHPQKSMVDVELESAIQKIEKLQKLAQEPKYQKLNGGVLKAKIPEFDGIWENIVEPGITSLEWLANYLRKNNYEKSQIDKVNSVWKNMNNWLYKKDLPIWKQGLDTLKFKTNFEEGYNPLDDERREQAKMDAEKRKFKRDELEAELAGEEERAKRYNQGPWYVRIDGKVVKDKNKKPYIFHTHHAANKAALTMMKKDWNKGKKFSLSRNPSDKTDVTEGKLGKALAVGAMSLASMGAQAHSDTTKSVADLAREKPAVAALLQKIGAQGQVPASDKRAAELQRKQDQEMPASDRRATELEKNESSEHKCPSCGGEMVSEELMSEKKDACYYKVKSRYKVWPSAYASGALVKCRKKGAKNWGKSKK